jgi:hypothetical protein
MDPMYAYPKADKREPAVPEPRIERLDPRLAWHSSEVDCEIIIGEGWMLKLEPSLIKARNERELPKAVQPNVDS